MYRLTLLGEVSLEGAAGPLSGRIVQRRQLALLSLLGSSRGRPMTREKVVGRLWGDRPEAKARRALSDTLYLIRDALGDEATIEGPREGLRLNEDLIWSDVTAFEEAADQGGWHEAVELYGGPFIDGFYVDWAGEFERWMEGERRRLASRHQDALEHLAEAAAAEGYWSGAAVLWEERAGEEPTNSRVILRLMRAEAAAGNVPGALEHARVHELLLREELGLPVPDDSAPVLVVLPFENLGDAQNQHFADGSPRSSRPGWLPFPAWASSLAPARFSTKGRPWTGSPPRT